MSEVERLSQLIAHVDSGGCLPDCLLCDDIRDELLKVLKRQEEFKE